MSASLTTLDQLPSGPGVFTKQNLDQINTNSTSQNTNNTNLSAAIDAIVAGGFNAQDGITALAGGAKPGTLLTKVVNRVSTVATAGDSVSLPASAPGLICVVINDVASKPIQVYGLGSDTINDALTGTGVPLIGDSMAVYFSSVAGKWFSIGEWNLQVLNLVANNIYDANGNISIALTATASAVNGLGVTNAATGNGATNPLTLLPSGTDTHVGLTIKPKGASGVLILGLADGTADVILGQSSATQTVKIGNGAGISTVNLANTTVAGATVNVAGAATGNGLTDTVNIATGATAGTGAKIVHIADGTPGGTGIQTVTIGGVTDAAHVTTIQGGNGASAIKLTPQVTGVITVGGSAGTGDIVVGSSSTTQTVKIGNGAGVATVNLANVSVAGANVNVAGAVTGAGITDTVSISGGNAASTGIKVVNIATGTPVTSGNNRVTVGGGVTSAVTLNAVVSSYQETNYIATESGSNNAIAGELLNAAGAAVTLAAGLRVVVKLAHSLQAGANAFVLNGTSKAILSHFNVSNNIATAYAATGIVDLMYDGTQWLDMSQ